MDRRVKERLIGASILVALFVLVVPELLSGPKPNAALAPTLPAAAAPEPIRNVTVDLRTSKPPENSELEPATAQPAAPGTAAPAAAAPAAVQSSGPASTAPASAAQTSVPSPAPTRAAASSSAPSSASAKPQARQAAARSAAAVESAAPSPTSMAHGSWSVQLGSFASRANADNLTRQVKGQGFPVFVLPGGSGSAMRYRVRVGPLSDRELAERMAAKLKALGHAGSLVAPAA
jgi:DedD protein